MKFSKTECGIKALAKSAGTITAEELDSAFKKLGGVEEIRAKKALDAGFNEQVSDFINKKVEAERFAAAASESVSAFKAIQDARFIGDMMEWKKQGFASSREGFITKTMGSLSDVKGWRNSVAGRIHDDSITASGNFYSELQERGVWERLKSGKEDVQFARAIEKASLTPEEWASRSYANEKVAPEIVEAGKFIHDFVDAQRKKMNSYGGVIGKMEGFITSMHWNTLKMKYADQGGIGLFEELGKTTGLINESSLEARRVASFEKFFNDTVDLIDWKKTRDRLDFGNLESFDKRKFLESVYDSRISGKNLNESTSGHGAANLINKTSNRRLIMWKDSDSFLQANKLYGGGDLLGMLLKDVDVNAKNAARMREISPNPKATLEKTIDSLTDPNRKTAEFDDWKIKSYINFLAGESEHGNPTWSAVNRTMRGYMTAVSLNFSGITSLVMDNVNVMAGLSTHGMLGDALTAPLQSIAAQLGDKELRLFMAKQGVGIEMALGTAHARAMPDTFDGSVARLTSFMMKYNGLAPITDALKRHVSTITGMHLADVAHLPMDKLDAGTIRLMDRYGITPDEWNLWRKTSQEIPGHPGKKMLLSDSIYAAGDDEIKALLGKPKASKFEVTQFHDSLRAKLGNLFTDFADTLVSTPDARLRAIVQDPGKGVFGEIIKHGLLFKSFAGGFMYNVLGGAYRTAGKGLPGAAAVAGAAATATAGGMLLYQVQEMAHGRKPPDPFNPKSLIAGFAKGGGLGFAGDLIAGNLQNPQADAGDFFAGPVISAAYEPLKIGSKQMRHILEGDEVDWTQFTTDALKYTKRLTPGINAPGIELGTNYLFYHSLMGGFNPRELEKIKENGEKNGKGGWWLPL